MVSFLPESEQHKLILSYDFYPITPYTITNRDSFVNELEETNQRGYSVDEQENELWGRCVGAPILNRFGYPIAAISISVPIQRFPKEDIQKYGRKLIAIAETISQQMGHLNGTQS
jgi:DNA-binding IclR family transcriptional regulator